MSPNAVSTGAEALQSMIAADLAQPSAPLQGEGLETGSSAALSATDATSQTEEATGQISADGADSGQPTSANSEEDDDFGVDLDKEPTAESADAPKGDDAQQSTEGDPDAKVGEFLATSRGKRIYAEFKKAQLLAKPDEEGGIGHSPTAEQTREYFSAFVDVQKVNNDFNSGTPDGIARWAERWFPADSGKAAEFAAHHLVDTLAQQNPAAYQAARAAFIQRDGVPIVQNLIDQARSAQDDAQAEKYYMAAQETHRQLFGRYFDPNLVTGSAQPQQQNQVHPDTLELQRLRAEQRANQQRQAQTEASAIVSEIDTKIDDALRFDVEQALSKVKGSVDPLIYEAVKDKMIAEVRGDIQRNQSANQVLEIAKSNAARSRSKDSIPNIVRQYRQLALEPLRSRYRAYITAAGQSVVNSNLKQHAQLQQSASKVGPASPGAPIAQDIRQAVIERKPGESHAEFMQRKVAADLSH